MQILDEDMQMVRNFLKQCGAPFHIIEHFENLLTQYQNAETRASDLADEVKELEGKTADRDELEQERDRLQEELNDIESDQEAALIAVKYGLHDALVLNVPMRTMPRDILRQVEDALQ